MSISLVHKLECILGLGVSLCFKAEGKPQANILVA